MLYDIMCIFNAFWSHCSVVVHTALTVLAVVFRDMGRESCSQRKCLTLCWLEKKETLQAFLGSAATSQPTGSLAAGGYFIFFVWVCVCMCVCVVWVCVCVTSCCYLHSLKVCMSYFSCMYLLSFPSFLRPLPGFPSWTDPPDLSFITLRGNLCISNTPPQFTVTHACLRLVWSFHKMCVCVCECVLMRACVGTVGREPLWFPKTFRSGLIAFRQQSLLKEEGKC